MPQTRHKTNPAAERREQCKSPQQFLAWCKDKGPGRRALAQKYGGSPSQWDWQQRLARAELDDATEARGGRDSGDPLSVHDLRARLGNQEFLNFVDRNGGPTRCAELFGSTQSTWSRSRVDARKDILVGIRDPAEELRTLEAENSVLRARNSALEDQWANLEVVVRRACKRFPYVAPKYPQPRHRKDSLEELVILDLSDFQAGQKVTEAETGGVETFDVEILKQRIERWKEKVYIIVNDVLRRSIPVHRALVILGGDLLEGETIYRGQAFHLDALALEQLVLLVNEVGAVLLFLLGMFERVDVKTVDGNHGLVWATSMNLDRFAYIMMRETLGNQPNLHWAISEAHMNAWTLGPPQFHHPQDCPSRTYLAIHGDEIKSYYSTPFYGSTRAYYEYTPVVGRLIDAMFIHHHHRSGVGPDGIWYQNGSFPGATDYSLKRMRGSARPQQWMLTYHQEVGITSHRPVFLADRVALPEGENGQLTTTLPELFAHGNPVEAYAKVRERLSEVDDKEALEDD